MEVLNETYIEKLKKKSFITQVGTNNDYYQDYVTQVGINTHLYDDIPGEARIVFEDPVMEQVCLAVFPHSQDDEGNDIFTFADARAVTEIPEGFLTSNNIMVNGENVVYKVTSFDEFKYFTNCTTIGPYAFTMTSLERLTIPRSVVNIPSGISDEYGELIPTMAGLPLMKSLKVDRANPKYTDMGANCIIEKDTMKLICATNPTIEKFPPIKSIGTYAIALIGLEVDKDMNYVDPEGSQLTAKLVLPSTLESMDFYAIEACGFDLMDMSACSKLRNAAINGSQAMKPFLAAGIFCNHFVFRNVKVGTGDDSNNVVGLSTSLAKTIKLTDVIGGSTGQGDVNVPSEDIGKDAFRNCRQLEYVYIDNSVKSIGQGAFFGCNNLKTVIIDNLTPPSMGNNTFLSPTSVANMIIYVPDDAVNSYKKHERWGTYTIQPIKSFNK